MIENTSFEQFNRLHLGQLWTIPLFFLLIPRHLSRWRKVTMEKSVYVVPHWPQGTLEQLRSVFMVKSNGTQSQLKHSVGPLQAKGSFLRQISSVNNSDI